MLNYSHFEENIVHDACTVDNIDAMKSQGQKENEVG